MKYKLPTVGAAKRTNDHLMVEGGKGAWVVDEDIPAKINLYSRYLAELLAIQEFLEAEKQAQSVVRAEEVAKTFWDVRYPSYSWEGDSYPVAKAATRAGARAVLASLETA